MTLGDIIQVSSIQFLFKIYFIDYAITVVPLPPFILICPAHPLPPKFPPALVHVHGSYI